MGEGKFSKSESNGRMGHCELGKEQDWQGQEKEKKILRFGRHADSSAWLECRVLVMEGQEQDLDDRQGPGSDILTFYARELDFAKVCSVLKIPVQRLLLS